MSAVAESFLRPIVAFRTFENLFHNRGRIGVPQCGLDRTQTYGAIGFSAFQGDSVLTSETLEFYIGHRVQNLSSGKVFCQFLLQLFRRHPVAFASGESAFPALAAVPVMYTADLSVRVGFKGTDCSAFFAYAAVPDVAFLSFLTADRAFASVPPVPFIPDRAANSTFTAVPAMAFIPDFPADRTLASVPDMVRIPSGAASCTLALLRRNQHESSVQNRYPPV